MNYKNEKARGISGKERGSIGSNTINYDGKPKGSEGKLKFKQSSSMQKNVHIKQTSYHNQAMQEMNSNYEYTHYHTEDNTNKIQK